MAEFVGLVNSVSSQHCQVPWFLPLLSNLQAHQPIISKELILRIILLCSSHSIQHCPVQERRQFCLLFSSQQLEDLSQKSPQCPLACPWLLYHVCMPKLGRREEGPPRIWEGRKTGLFQPGRRNDCGIVTTHGQHPTLFLSYRSASFNVCAFVFNIPKPSLLLFRHTNAFYS